MNGLKNNHFVRSSCLLVLFLLLPLAQILAQAKTCYAKQALLQDIDILVSDIEEIHPNPFHSIEKSDFIKRLQNIKREIPDTISTIEAWKACYKTLAMLNEGHCYVVPPVEEIGDFFAFPYTIKIDKDSNTFIVKGALSDSIQAPIGKRILAINGVSCDSLLTIFKSSTSAENEALFLYMNEKHFDISLYAIFGSPAYFDVEFLGGDKVEKQRCNSIQHLPERKPPYYSFRMVDDSIGLIDMNRLNDYPDFKRFCKSSFRTMKKKGVKHLIIDFRGNGGGDSQLGDELIKYLSDLPFIQYQKAIAKVSAISREEFNYAYKKDTLIVRELANSTKHMIQPYPKKRRFSGAVYVLIDGGTYSSAGSTVWCIDHYDLAIMIGSETGGTGVHYGYPVKRKLPNTGLTYFISHMKWYQIGADDTSCHGVFPDYKIDVSVEDILNKRDAALQLAFDLINRKIN